MRQLKVLMLMVVILTLPLIGRAQTVPSGLTGVEIGADTYNAAKYPNGYINLVGVQSGNTGWPYVTVDFHPTGIIGQFTYDFRAGVEQVVAQTASGYQFLAFGQAGIAQSAAAAGGIFSGGIGILLPSPSWGHGWHLVIAAEGMTSSVANTTAAIRVGLRHGF